MGSKPTFSVIYSTGNSAAGFYPSSPKASIETEGIVLPKPKRRKTNQRFMLYLASKERISQILS